MVCSFQVTVQTCSVIRNFVYNPIATQAFVDAFERFALAFFNFEMPLFIVITFYSVFPLICIALAVYNSFISNTLTQTDDVCETIRRTQWTNTALLIIQWGSAVIAILLYIIVWRKLHHERTSKFAPNENEKWIFDSEKMCPNRYYWDHHVVKIFFICCALPLFLALPSLVFTILTDLEIYVNSVANVVSILILDLTTPVTLIIYIFFIEHIRKGLLEYICRCDPELRKPRPLNQKVIEHF
ncbi:unnamed protein product [Strongylus vulgaris]|uniref:Uncharacterized protein n=1 Tax=Strongylus vulgaris TaxID=40348 RepID=A0A3P7J9Y1_STRVU|nr:unnamed protein product [Strongylus vulgaris]